MPIAMPGLRWNPPFGYLVCLQDVQRVLRGKGWEHPTGAFEGRAWRLDLGLILFGAVGFVKLVHANKWPGQCLVLCHHLGMRCCTGEVVWATRSLWTPHRDVIKGTLAN